MSDKIPTKKGSNKINPKNLAKVSGLKSVADTTVIKTPYKVFPSEINEYNPSDSTKSKRSFNLTDLKNSLLKRNKERKEEGKNPITLQSITGTIGVGMSNKGKTFKESPIKKNSK